MKRGIEVGDYQISDEFFVGGEGDESDQEEMDHDLDADYSALHNPEGNHSDKAVRNRERNREHAKRTRLRKKEMMEKMKFRLLDLQREVRT